MKKQLLRFASLLAAMLICVGALGSCNDTSDDENGSESESSTEESTEPALPRFDYFAADMNDYVQLDSSVYTNMEVTVSGDLQITDEDVDDYVEYLRFQNKAVLNDGARYTDKPIALGDTAYIYFRGEMDGKEFEGGSNMSDESPYALSIGSGSFIEGFEEGLIGVIPNETSTDNMKALNLKFPDNYQNNPDVAGKEVTFYVQVMYTVQYEVPEYNEEFITEVLKYEPETDDVVTEHKAYLKQLLLEYSEESREGAIEDAIWEKLIDAATIVEYPEEELEYYYQNIIDNMTYNMEYYTYMGYSFEDFDDFAVQYMGLEEGADWEAVVEEQSRNMAAQNMIYHFIAQRDNVSLTDEDVTERIQYFVDYYKSMGTTYTSEDIIEMMGEDFMRESALYNKIYSPIRENCTVIYED